MTRPLFIHIPKAAGMSVRHGLGDKIRLPCNRASDYAEPGYTIRLADRMRMHGEHCEPTDVPQHARWRDVSEKLKKRDAFAVIRNPWARVASRFFFGRFVATQTHKPEHVNYLHWDTFDTFLEERHTWGKEPYYWHRGARGWYPAVDYVTDEAGEIRVTCLRCEHLEEDLKAYRGWTLPERRRNVTANAVPYRDLYTESQKRIVAQWYARDIETFGIRFDGCATRNIL